MDTSTLSDEKDTISQSELTGLTECDVSICDDSEDDFFRDEEWPIPEHMVIPRMTADSVNRTVRNRNNNRGRCSWPGSENDITSDENSSQIDRPFTKLTTAGDGIKNDSLSVDYVKCGEIPVTKLIPVGVLDTEEQLVMRVSTITSELSAVETSSYSGTDINDIHVIEECVRAERRRREQLCAYANTQLLMNNYQRGVTDCCFGVCGMTDSLNRSEIGWYWNCVDWLLWGYRVSCLVTIVIKDRSYGIDLYTEVIFDNFVVLVSRLLVVFHTDFYCVINVIVYIYRVCCVGLGARLVVTLSGGGGGGALCVEVPVTLVRVYLGMVTCFGAWSWSPNHPVYAVILAMPDV